MRGQVIVLAGLALGTAGCGSSASRSAVRSTSGAESGGRPVRIATTTKHVRLTGWGASEATWISTHKEDTRHPLGTAFDASSALGKVGGHPADAYTQVLYEVGHVFSYEYHFQPVSISQAKAEVLRSQFPGETRIVWFANKGQCAQMLVQSDALRGVLEDKEGTALVEFGGETTASGEEAYDESAVRSAFITSSIAESSAGSSSALGC